MHTRYLNKPSAGSLAELIVVAACCCAAAETPQAEKLRSDLKREPFERSVLAPYMKAPNPAIISAVREAFLEANDPTADGQRSFADIPRAIERRVKKRQLAFALCTMKGDDGTAFNYLLKLADQGVSSDAPMVLSLDRDGKEVRGKTSPEFDEWSGRHGMDVKEAATFEVAVYIEDLVMLSALRDPRSKPTFERGLQSNNLTIVSACIFGLGSLNATDSIPLIRSATQKTMGLAAARDGFAVSLTGFKGPEATSIIRKEFAGTPILPVYEKCIQKRSK